MSEHDIIRRVIQSDLDRLPLLPADRWVPPATASRSRLNLTGVASVVGVVFLLIVAIGIGQGVRGLREQRAATQKPEAVTPAASTSPQASQVDCGNARLPDASSTYDQRMLDCVWVAYTRGETARVSITVLTQEGDPVPTTLLAVPGGWNVVTRDLTRDRFTGAAGRIVSTSRCTAMTRRPWATDPARFSFELSNCTGPRPTESFP